MASRDTPEKNGGRKSLSSINWGFNYKLGILSGGNDFELSTSDDIGSYDQSIGFQEFDQEIDGYSDWMDRMNVPFIMGIAAFQTSPTKILMCCRDPHFRSGNVGRKKTLDIESIPTSQHSALSFISDFSGLNTWWHESSQNKKRTPLKTTITWGKSRYGKSLFLDGFPRETWVFHKKWTSSRLPAMLMPAASSWKAPETNRRIWYISEVHHLEKMHLKIVLQDYVRSFLRSTTNKTCYTQVILRSSTQSLTFLVRV